MPESSENQIWKIDCPLKYSVKNEYYCEKLSERPKFVKCNYKDCPLKC